MAYRNGTYVAFHAGGTTDPSASDIKYYNSLRMWAANSSITFNFVDGHEKTGAVRDTSRAATLRRALVTRLRNSKQFLLIVTSRTKLDTDWARQRVGHKRRGFLGPTRPHCGDRAAGGALATYMGYL